MEYLTSRGFVLPGSADEMGNKFWFNMWRTMLWPYEELVAGDVLYWYESPTRRIVWKTRVSVVQRFRYHDKGQAADIMEAKFGNFDKGQAYLVEAPTAGFCLAWKVVPIQRLNIQKPSGVRFPRQGWLRVQGPVVNEWLSSSAAGDDVILDDMVVGGAALLPTLEDLNRSVSGVSPVRIASIVHRTIRRDSALVTALKELCGFRCQVSKLRCRHSKARWGVLHRGGTHRAGQAGWPKRTWQPRGVVPQPP